MSQGPADGRGLHPQPLPGTDLVLLLGISHVIHEGLADAGYNAARTTGYQSLVRSVNAWDTATAAINLALLLGLPGSARSGDGTLTGQGGHEHGQKADQLPGCRKITDPRPGPTSRKSGVSRRR
jgi:assimilatory nitrate reductase catalytic subunit